MRMLVVPTALLATSVASAQIKNFTYCEHHKGIVPSKCYVVGFDTDLSQWYGVCKVVVGLQGTRRTELHHREIVYWDSTAAEKSSKTCDKDCPERPVGMFTIFYPAGGGTIPLYMVATDSSTGTIGGNSALGDAMLLFP